tara:strand:- start:15781 stop:16194 length:414 start_codon:yes stop_codon:yes gene_type:complete
MIRLINIKEMDILKEDPVRPNVDKTGKGKQVYVLDDLSAVVCVCYCKDVPTTEIELEEYKEEYGDIAVAYTVWSNKPGAGREIIFELRDLFIDAGSVDRLITMSPKTEMAKRFHERNGATLLQDNAESYNFEYELRR